MRYIYTILERDHDMVSTKEQFVLTTRSGPDKKINVIHYVQH